MGNYDEFWASMPEQTPTPPLPLAAPDSSWGAPMAYAPAPVLDAPPAGPDWAPPVTPAGWLPPTGYPGVGAPVKTSRGWGVRKSIWVPLAVLLALAGGAATYYKVQTLRPLHTPDTLARAPRLNTPEMSRITEEAKAQLRSDGADRAVAAVYGVGVPELVLVAGSDHGYSGTDEAFDDAKKGFVKGSQGSAGAGRTFDDGAGEQVRCTTFSVGVSGAFCIWVTTRTTGMVVWFGADMKATAAVTGEARKAVEA